MRRDKQVNKEQQETTDTVGCLRKRVNVSLYWSLSVAAWCRFLLGARGHNPRKRAWLKVQH